MIKATLSNDLSASPLKRKGVKLAMNLRASPTVGASLLAKNVSAARAI
ncbi:hypothetical protein [Pseudomonas libanensis]|nr:hypothetical protein [Pseudomonas libanensis]